MVFSTIIVIFIIAIIFGYVFPNCGGWYFTKTSWQKINSNVSSKLDERLLTVKFLNINGKKDQEVLVFIHDKKVSLYLGIERGNLIQEFELPGKFISYSFDTVYDNLYFTINDNGQNRFVVYEYRNNQYKLLMNSPSPYSNLEYSFTKPNCQSSDNTISLISEDRCKIQLFEPVYKSFYEFKHSKPFKVTKRGINQVFDGDRIFNIYTPDVTEAKFDYSGIAFDCSKLDLSNLLVFGNGWFFNNGYLIIFDSKSYKALSVTQIGDVIDITSFESNKASDDISAGYVYITKDGIYKSNWKTKTTILNANKLTRNNFFYGSELNIELYATTEGSNTKIIAVGYKGLYGNKEIEELGITPGRFQGLDVIRGDIYAYTTEGVFKNNYTHLKYLESQKSQ